MDMPKDKLIYILNHYSDKSSSHFYHIINLLENIAEQGIQIALIIEKCEQVPKIESKNIDLYPINTSKLKRILTLNSVLVDLHKKGYAKIFIRISWIAAVISIFTSFFTGQRIYYWKSGQGTLEYYDSLRFGLKKFSFWLSDILTFWFIKTNIDFLVTGPESMANYYYKSWNVPKRKILILYNDIDTDRFKLPDHHWKQKAKELADFDKDQKIILFVHRFSPVRKNSYYLPHVLDQFFKGIKEDQPLFLMVGEGPEKAGIESKVKSRPYTDNVLFLGEKANAEIEKYYKLADIFIQPTGAEGFPRTLLEAMACGLPLVTTNAGGIIDLLGPGQLDYMVDVTDRDGFASKLIQLFKDPSAWEKLSEENRKTAMKYDTRFVAKMYVSKLFGRK